jgi:hypothetical protein
MHVISRKKLKEAVARHGDLNGHDENLDNLCGYPQEGLNGQSVILKVPYQMNLSAPDGQVGNWSFLLTTFPWTCGDALSGIGELGPYNLYANYLSPTGSPVNVHPFAGPVTIYRGNDGNELGPFHVSDLGNVPPVGLSLEDGYTKGPHRLIGWGIEVYDTTAVIAKQGSCTVWRQNTNTLDKTSFTVGNPAGTLIGALSGIIVRRPPSDIGEANKLAGTKSWKSEDGCYLVPTLNSSDIPVKQADDTQPIIFQADVQTGVRSVGFPAGVLTGPTLTNTVGASTILSPAILFNLQPWNMTGAFFTGLAPSATFLVRTVFYIERFPSPDENDIVLVTKPSAKYDPLALEIYDHMVHNMPVGVPVDDNGLGEWFYEAIKSAASFVLPVISKTLLPAKNPPPVTYSTQRTPAVKPRRVLPPMAPQRMAVTAPRIPKNLNSNGISKSNRAENQKIKRKIQLRQPLSNAEIAFVNSRK